MKNLHFFYFQNLKIYLFTRLFSGFNHPNIYLDDIYEYDDIYELRTKRNFVHKNFVI